MRRTLSWRAPHTFSHSEEMRHGKRHPHSVGMFLFGLQASIDESGFRFLEARRHVHEKVRRVGFGQKSDGAIA